MRAMFKGTKRFEAAIEAARSEMTTYQRRIGSPAPISHLMAALGIDQKEFMREVLAEMVIRGWCCAHLLSRPETPGRRYFTAVDVDGQQKMVEVFP